MAGRFKLDENLPGDAESVFSGAGHDAETALQEQLGGRPDPDIYLASLNENRILVTLDLDFADIRQYPPSDHPGIWVLRPASQGFENILALVRGALSVFEAEASENQLWIVEHGRVRIHE